MLNLKHGEHILDEGAPPEDRAKLTAGVLKARENALHPQGHHFKGTPFGYLFPEIAKDPNSHLPADNPKDIVAALQALGAAMGEAEAPPEYGNSTIPTVYTYFGQFIDHDLTANTDRDSKVSDIRDPNLKPLPPGEVVERLKNLRRPALELDSVYGSGPGGKDAGFYDGAKFRIGQVTPVGGLPIPPEGDLDRDLPRVGPLLSAGVITDDDLTEEQRRSLSKNTLAFIGDARNDENLIVAQLHLAFLRFHNQVVEEIKAHPSRFGLFGPRHDTHIFERARQLTRWHYQWIVVHDWLETVTQSGIVDKVLLRPKHYRPQHDELFMPLEFSVAGFRFGHTLVRGAYDHNRNFGVEKELATLEQLFLFTGDGFQIGSDGIPVRNPMLGFPTLPSNWIIEWDRFTEEGSTNPIHFTRKLDTFLTPSLLTMPNQGNDKDTPPDISKLLKTLPARNLLRGYLLSIPTGQAVAKALGVPALSETELREGNTPEVNAALTQGGFIERTPLWFYLLKEAQVRANGNSLGETGSRLIAETIIGLLEHDRSSFLNQRGGWDPSKGVTLPNGDSIVTIRDFFQFAGVFPKRPE